MNAITANQQLKLRRLELDRAAICKALGIVDDETAELPLLVANMLAKQGRIDRLLHGITKELESPTPQLTEVVRWIVTEVGT